MFLTRRQKQVYEFVRTHILDNGYAPSIEEIKHEFGLSAVSTVHKHLKFLEKKGLLKRVPHQNRGLELVEDDVPERDPMELPLLGTIAAGQPIEAVELNDTVSIPKEFFASNKTYVLKVRGNSMIEEQIKDGDYVIIEKRDTAVDGEVVVALIENSEATLKKFYHQKDGMVRLEPANQELQPIFVPEDQLRVQGRVVGVLRKF